MIHPKYHFWGFRVLTLTLFIYLFYMILVRANSLELVKVLDDSSVSDHFPLRPILNIAINDPKKKKSI